MTDYNYYITSNIMNCWKSYLLIKDFKRTFQNAVIFDKIFIFVCQDNIKFSRIVDKKSIIFNEMLTKVIGSIIKNLTILFIKMTNKFSLSGKFLMVKVIYLNLIDCLRFLYYTVLFIRIFLWLVSVYIFK